MIPAKIHGLAYTNAYQAVSYCGLTAKPHAGSGRYFRHGHSVEFATAPREITCSHCARASK